MLLSFARHCTRALARVGASRCPRNSSAHLTNCDLSTRFPKPVIHNLHLSASTRRPVVASAARDAEAARCVPCSCRRRLKSGGGVDEASEAPNTLEPPALPADPIAAIAFASWTNRASYLASMSVSFPMKTSFTLENRVSIALALSSTACHPDSRVRC